MDAHNSTELTPVHLLPHPDHIKGEGWTVLYSLGSFAPAHTNHMELIVLARQLCEQRGMRVAGIVFAPTADISLKNKLGYLPMPLEARYKCLSLLIANTSGFDGVPVIIDRYLAEGDARGAAAAGKHLEEELNKRYEGRVRLRSVFGLDALTKVKSRTAIENGIIVLNRQSSEVGEDPDAFVARHPCANIIQYIAAPTWKEATLSSTKLRSMFTLGEDISNHTHPEFVQYLHANEITLGPPATVAADFSSISDLVTNLYHPSSEDGKQLQLIEGWSDKFQTVHFQELVADAELGAGRQAQISNMKWNGERVAVKRPQGQKTGCLKLIAREIYFLALLGPHPHVVRLLGAGFTPNGIPFEVLQLAVGGSASAELKARPPHLLQNDPRTPQSISWIRILHHIAIGMSHLHQHGILHRDLSTDNVLLSARPEGSNCVAMLADFGVAKEVGDANTVIRGACRKYSPEALGTKEKASNKKGKPSYIYTPASDVFMFATLAYEVLTGQCYFQELDVGAACSATLAGKRPDFPVCAAFAPLINLVHECWAQEASNRPEFSDIAARLQAFLDSLH